jgi:signal transduction histidine kinase
MTDRSLAETVLWCHPTAIIAIDGTRRVGYANRAALHLLAASEESVLGTAVVELFGGDGNLDRTIDSVFGDSEERRIRIEFPRHGRRIRVGMTLSPYPEGAPPSTMLLSFRDLKERRLLDDRVVQLERLASAGRLVAGFAHQLRNPLAALSALLENLEAETPSNDPRIEYTSRMLNQIGRIEKLIRACLEFSMDPSVVRQRLTGESLGRAAIAGFEARFGVAPPLVVNPGVGDVVVHGEQIAKCLGLLLENAFDACGDVSKMRLEVSVESRDTAAFVCFAVGDEGPGIQRADLVRLFEPFYTTKPRREGIGLAVAQSLAVSNGGTLEVFSEPGDTQFVLLLRAAEGANDEAEPVASTGC